MSSRDWARRAEAITPGGAQTRSKRATAYPPGYPRVLIKGRGCHVWDVEDGRYIDWVCGLASIGLGYCHDAVDAAVTEQMLHGVSFSLPTDTEIVAAEAVCGALGAEQVRFCKTGSEATEGAMRIARLATGRSKVVSIGYHGWHSIHDAACASHPGVPRAFEAAIVGWDIKDRVLPNADDAAFLVETTRDDPPPPGYLQELRDACTKTGTLLIFDEIVTGFRWALRGGSEFFGVEPDLRCYGKAMANGYPLAAIVGPRHLMSHAAYVSGTFGGEALSLAAAMATIEVYQKQDVIAHLWRIGTRLMTDFNGLPPDLRRGIELVGYPVHPRFIGPARDRFLTAAAAEGLLFHPAGFNVSLAHDDTIVDETVAACRRALETLA